MDGASRSVCATRPILGRRNGQTEAVTYGQVFAFNAPAGAVAEGLVAGPPLGCRGALRLRYYGVPRGSHDGAQGRERDGGDGGA